MKHSFIFVTSFMLILFFCGCGCGRAKPEKPRKEHVFPKIKNHKMELRIISERADFYCGENNASIRFQLFNNGMNAVHIPDWRANLPQNISIEYAPCENGKASAVTEWKSSLTPTTKLTPWRYPLDLNPRNSVIVDVPLDFIRTLKQKGNYAVRGRLNLTSLPIASYPVEIIVK